MWLIFSDWALASESEQRAVALAHARWAACLHEAFSPAPPWPPAADTTSRAGRLEPRHIDELHDEDGRLAELHIPPTVAHDVELIRAHGFHIHVVDDAIIATAPDGRGSAQVSRSGVAPNSSVAVLHRQRWLQELAELGLTVQPGPGGKPQVATNLQWRPDRTVEQPSVGNAGPDHADGFS